MPPKAKTTKPKGNRVKPAAASVKTDGGSQQNAKPAAAATGQATRRRPEMGRKAKPQTTPGAPPTPAATPAAVVEKEPKKNKDKAMKMSNVVRFSTRSVNHAVEGPFIEHFAPKGKVNLTGGKHLHPWSHACRAEALHALFHAAAVEYERTCAAYLAAEDGEMEKPSDFIDVLSLYGADSEHWLVESFNTAIQDRGPHFRLTTCTPHKFEGDAVRHYTKAIDSDSLYKLFATGRRFYSVHLVDIYQCGASADRPLDPAFMRMLTAHSINNRVTAVLRSFHGCAGADPRVGPVQEGVWYRNKRGLIVFHPEGDRRSTPYPPHPDCNWLFESRSTEGLDLAVSRVFGPYSLVHASKTHPDAIPVLCSDKPALGEYIMVHPELTCFSEDALGSAAAAAMARADRVLPKEVKRAIDACQPVMAHSDTLAEYLGDNAVVLNGFTMNGLRQKVKRSLDKAASFQALKAVVPNHVLDDIVVGTTLAVVFNGRKRFAELVLGRRQEDVEAQAAFTAAFAANPGTSAKVWLARVAKISLGVAAVAITGSWLALFAHYAVGHAGVHLTMLKMRTVGKMGPSVTKQGAMAAWATGCLIGTGIYWKKGQRAVQKRWSSSRMHYEEYCEVLASGGEGPAPCVKTYLESAAERAAWSVPLEAQDTLPCASVSRAAIADPHGRMHVFMDGQEVTHADAKALVSCTPTGEFYPTVSFACGLAPPSANGGNMLHAMAARSLPLLPAINKQMQEHAAEVCASLMTAHVMPLEPQHMVTPAECVSLMPTRQGKRLQAAFDAAEKGQTEEYECTKKKTMLKRNEVIKVGAAIKPRLLDCLEPAHTAATIQAARATLDGLKRSFNLESSTMQVGDWALQILICSGATPEYMDRIGACLRNRQNITILIAGDDVTIYWGPYAGFVGYEASEFDAEKFDITQKMAILRQTARVFEHILRDCPIGPEPIRYFLDVATKKLTWSCRRTGLRIDTHPECRAPTGTTFTTSMNCTASVFWVVHHFRFLPAFGSEHCTPDAMLDCADSAAELGFKLTSEHHNSVTGAIFLKGTFVEDDNNEFKFCCLPSQVLKLGKSVNKMTIAQRTKNPNIALARHVGAIGRSMPHVPDDLPVLGVFLATMRRCGDVEEEGVIEDLNDNPYKVVAGNNVSRRAYLDFVMERYDCEEGDVEELEEMIAAAKAPCLISHRLVARMALRDYY